MGRVETVISLLLRLRHPAQVIAVCGKNTELKERLDQVAAAQDRHPRVRLKVVGYTNAMQELMAASDLIVGKPGGMTMCESLASGLVWVVVNPIPGQEERNSDHLLEEGCAIKCNNLPTLTYKIDHLLDDPARLETMRQNSLRLARPDAAFVIANVLKRLADEPLPPLPAPVEEESGESSLLTWLAVRPAVPGGPFDMSRQETLARILDGGLVAVVRASDPSQLVEVVRALADGGLTAAEITFTVPDAIEVIRQVRKALGDKIVLGAGTVLDPETGARRCWPGLSSWLARRSIST